MGAVAVSFAFCLYRLRWDLTPDLFLPHLGDCSAELLVPRTFSAMSASSRVAPYVMCMR